MRMQVLGRRRVALGLRHTLISTLPPPPRLSRQTEDRQMMLMCVKRRERSSVWMMCVREGSDKTGSGRKLMSHAVIRLHDIHVSAQRLVV